MYILGIICWLSKPNRIMTLSCTKSETKRIYLLSHNSPLLYIKWYVLFVFRTIEVSLAIQRQASLLAHEDYHGHSFSLFSRLLKSPLPSRDKQVRWHAETIVVSRSLSILKDCWSLCRDFIVSLCFCKTSRLLFIYLMLPMFFLLTGFTDWASGRSGGEVARTKLVSLSLLIFYLQ